ncbi:hypothetical protein MPSEU_000465700 [Mayamaea pseudoterrestris]|nr:hypothetical protein MPSEU_000465700 [Mayamaea pseudoterrestris]
MPGASRLPLQPPLMVQRHYVHHKGHTETTASPIMQEAHDEPIEQQQVLEQQQQQQVVQKEQEKRKLQLESAIAQKLNHERREASNFAAESSHHDVPSHDSHYFTAALPITNPLSSSSSASSSATLELPMQERLVPRGGRRSSHQENEIVATRVAPPMHHDEMSIASSPPPTPGTASILSEVMTLTKAIVGAGVLGLPAGLATFYTLAATHDMQMGTEGTSATFATASSSYSLGHTIFGPTLLLITAIGSASAIGFDCIASVCDTSHSVSYREAWARTVSPKTSYIPAIACLLVTTCTTVTCSMILKSNLGTVTFLFTTLCVLLPLCLQQSLQKLAPFSVVGTIGMIYTAVVMLLRYVSGAYTAASKFAFLNDMEESVKPVLGKLVKSGGSASTAAAAVANPWLSLLNLPKAAILISMLSTSFMAHYNAPKLYWELRDTSPQRFRKVILGGFGLAVALMSTIALSGFLTFGSASAGMILRNYASTDGLAVLAKAAVTMSVIFTVPLAFCGVRNGALDLLMVAPEQRQGRVTTMATVAGLALVTCLALVLKDVRLVLALGGSTWGMCVIYLFPALMVIHGAETYPVLKPKVQMAKILGGVGLVVGTMGIYRTLTTLI